MVIKDKLAKLGNTCTAGYEWEKTLDGYQCSAGGHKFSYEELGIRR